jgi:hypothetical protein
MRERYAAERSKLRIQQAETEILNLKLRRAVMRYESTPSVAAPAPF